MSSFLLRFQETMLLGFEELPVRASPQTISAFRNPRQNLTTIVAGTQTLTNVRAEAIDADPKTTLYSVLPKQDNSL